MTNAGAPAEGMNAGLIEWLASVQDDPLAFAMGVLFCPGTIANPLCLVRVQFGALFRCEITLALNGCDQTPLSVLVIDP